MRLLRVELCRIHLYHSQQRSGVELFPTETIETIIEI